MFGFDGATFDPGGAGNITQFSEYNDWVTKLQNDHPELIINNGPDGAFTNYLVDHSLVSGWIGDHIGGTEQLDFFAYAANEELIIETSTQVAHYALDQFNLGFLADAVTGFLTTWVLHDRAGILDLMNIKKSDEITASLQKRIQQTLQQASDTGDIGISGSSYGQSQIEFRSSSYNPYVFANDNDNTIFGYAGNDIIYGFAGNDTVYADDGNDTINPAQGNDVIDAGAGRDTVHAGSGDDVISVAANNGEYNDEVSGGSGTDKLSIDFSANSFAGLYWYGYDTSGASTTYWPVGYASSMANIQAALNNAVTFSVEAFIAYSGHDSVRFDGIENLSLTGSDNGFDDLVIVQGYGNYDGKGGTDTVYADWSTATDPIVWNNLPKTTQTVNGSTVTSLERLLLTTGSGNDKLANTTVTTDDTFITGAGNDTLNGGAGNDVLTGGTGNDTYVVDTTNDVITELKSEGIDTVNSPISWTLQANLENLTLLGKTAINATGNTLNNILTGNAAANTLNGGTGADKMTGGLSNDVYVVDKVGDKVIETSTLATEIDSVKSSVSYTLGINVENLTLTGTAALNGTGNGSANTLIGNTANNLLLGNAGKDTLSGGAGNDKLDGGTGNDVLTGGAGLDLFRFTTAPTANKDTLTDFSVADDTIQLENAVFKKFTAPGVLKAANFVKAGAAHDLNDYLVYNPATGALSYDADGSGAGAGVQIALLGVNLALTNADFVII